jgi:predicted Fe-S protein YdhL (DUF1289 family)
VSEPAIESPCIDWCRLDATGTLCTGCWRTLAEITAWRDLTDDERGAVMAKVERRKPRLAGRNILFP